MARGRGSEPRISRLAPWHREWEAERSVVNYRLIAFADPAHRPERISGESTITRCPLVSLEWSMAEPDGGTVSL